MTYLNVSDFFFIIIFFLYDLKRHRLPLINNKCELLLPAFDIYPVYTSVT